MPEGTVRWFDTERGFGFVGPDDGSEDLFVHATDIVAGDGPRVLREGQAVEFELGHNARGPQAVRVRVTADSAPGAVLGVLGTVSWYEPAKGYGFVAPDGGGAEVFVHSSAVVGGGVLSDGQRVAFLVGEGEKGPQAEHLLPLAPGAGTGSPPAPDGADGTVSWFDEERGFGFLTPDDGAEDVFVHVRSLSGGATVLEEGDRVTYDVVGGDRGPQARDVRVVGGRAVRAQRGRAGTTAARQPRRAAGDPPSRGGEGDGRALRRRARFRLHHARLRQCRPVRPRLRGDGRGAAGGGGPRPLLGPAERQGSAGRSRRADLISAPTTPGRDGRRRSSGRATGRAARRR